MGNTRSGPGPIRSNPNQQRFNPIAPGPGRTRPTRFGPPNPSGNAPSTSTASNPGGAAPSTSSTTNPASNTTSTSSTTNPGGNTTSSANQAALTRLNSPVNTAGTGVDLNRHELQGGHTIARHAGKPQTFLDARLAGTAGQGRTPKTAGTFNNQATAERVTGDNIRANEQKINNFLAGSQRRLPINSTMLSSDGTIRHNPGAPGNPLPFTSPPASGVRTILEKDSAFPGGFRIVTSYPEP
ncbi:RNase A-like domain-containing protein [Streptomyces chartreusis]|uniref:RNase A-like domain-containing protein n=1 Tax=Streptomyces chartreusis TaxID=1969 RepID=UPI003697A5F1